jgi:hypothetical protein
MHETTNDNLHREDFAYFFDLIFLLNVPWYLFTFGRNYIYIYIYLFIYFFNVKIL